MSAHLYHNPLFGTITSHYITWHHNSLTTSSHDAYTVIP